MKMKKERRIISTMLAIALVLGLFAASPMIASAEGTPDLAIGTWAGSGANPGDGHRTVTMGNYNGHELVWRVLDVYVSDGTDGNAAGNKTALLLLDDLLRTSAGGIEYRAFDSTYPASDCGNWARPSDIKAFLNGAFYDSAFSADEKADIITANYKMGGPYEGQYGFPATDSSKIFLISTDDVNNPAYFASNADRTAADYWRLRSPGSISGSAAYVTYAGSVNNYGFYVYLSNGVRPALKINLSSVIFTSADYSAVEAAIAAANALDKDLYAGFSGVEAAVAAVEYGLPEAEQARVDGFAAAINDAVAALKLITYTVTFVDWDGAVLKTQEVEIGSAAVAPTTPARAGFTFAGWDTDFSNVTEDLTVMALYYGISSGQPGTQVFDPAVVGYPGQNHKTGTVTNTGSVPTGTLSVALIGANPSAFALSKTSISSIAAGKNDTFDVWPVTGLSAGTYTATVRVYNANVSLTTNISFTVNKTYPILTPNTPANNAAYTYPDDVVLTATLSGAYPDNAGKTVTFAADGTNYTAVTNAAGVATFNIASPDAAAYVWNASYAGDANNNAATSASRSYTVNKTSPTLTLTAVPEDLPTYTESVTLTAALSGALPSSEGRIVTFTVNGANYDVLTDASGIAAFAVTGLTEDTYNFSASFAGDTNNNAAAAGPLNSYKVSFVDWNGDVLKTQIVNQGGGATAPADPSRHGYTFDAWDVTFGDIDGPLTVTAMYTINIYTVSFYKQSQDNSNQVAKVPFATQLVTYNELIDFTGVSVGKNAVWYFTDGKTFGVKFDIMTPVDGDLMIAVKDQNNNQQ